MRDKAMAEIDRALAIRREASTYVARAGMRERTEWDARLADVAEALRLAPDDYNALFTKARILEDKGDYGAAAETFQQILKSHPNDAYLLNGLGISLIRAGRASDAEQYLAQARKLAADASTLNGICYNKATSGVALERALDECNEALKLEPGAPHILDSRGTVLLRMGRTDEAIADFDKALAQMPGLAATHYARAIAWSRKGDNAKARADQQAALRIDPWSVERFAAYGLTIESAKHA
jgi:tetratricopeptide (TPR) repeat protein